MDLSINIHLATPDDADAIAAMPVALTDEMMVRTDTPHSDVAFYEGVDFEVTGGGKMRLAL